MAIVADRASARKVNPRDYRFFRDYAAGWVGHTAQNGLDLARAERYARDHEWSYTWEWDPDAELGDHWCEVVRRNGHLRHYYACHGRYPETVTVGRNGRRVVHSERPRECDHQGECCVLRDEEGTILGSLGSIIDADDHYRRVVEAELALDAMHDDLAFQADFRRALE